MQDFTFKSILELHLVLFSKLLSTELHSFRSLPKHFLSDDLHIIILSSTIILFSNNSVLYKRHYEQCKNCLTTSISNSDSIDIKGLLNGNNCWIQRNLSAHKDWSLLFYSMCLTWYTIHAARYQGLIISHCHDLSISMHMFW